MTDERPWKVMASNAANGYSDEGAYVLKSFATRPEATAYWTSLIKDYIIGDYSRRIWITGPPPVSWEVGDRVALRSSLRGLRGHTYQGTITEIESPPTCWGKVAGISIRWDGEPETHYSFLPVDSDSVKRISI